jgi:hypothetical protein
MITIDPQRRPFTSQIFRFQLITFVALVMSAGMLLDSSGGVAKADRGPGAADAAQAPQAGLLLISEFRLRGAGGATDEFIEIYNNSGTSHTVAPLFGTGYGVVTSDGVVRCTIPNGTVIPARGHYLCANSSGYSLITYPGGNGNTNANATFVLDIPDNIGIALFNNNSNVVNFTLANRFDAVGPNTESNFVFTEGVGYTPVSATNVNFSFFRRFDRTTGLPADGDNNATDFVFADPQALSLGPQPHLGAPGPENLNSPVFINGTFGVASLDATKAVSIAPNRVRDPLPDVPNNSTLGTVSVRRRFVNQTGGPITRLRFRIIDLSSFPVTDSVAADLRPRTSTTTTVSGINDVATCAAEGFTPPCTVTLQGTTLETPAAQPNGGGLNSSLSVGSVSLATPLAAGASVNVQFLLGVQTNGTYRFVCELEALPTGGIIFQATGNTALPVNGPDAFNPVADFDGDGRTDISVFRPSMGTWYLQQSTAGFAATGFGLSTDRIVPADFDRDGKTDIAVYRPSTGAWFILNSSNNTLVSVGFGIAEDLPTPGDYDGDGIADISVFRPSTGAWYRINSSTGAFFSASFGVSGDKPAIGDYDGDGKFDLSVFRPSLGAWFRINSSTGSFAGVTFGLATDLTAPGDFDGDGKTDISVFRPSEGNWFRLNSSNGAFVGVTFGTNGDSPTPGDYDLDGKDDISVFRPSNGSWHRLNSSNGALVSQFFGLAGDLPVPAAFRF